MRKKIWVFCFEYAGVAKVGGLGEVSANQCKSLVNDPELDIHVFMPSHGRHLDLKQKLNLSPLKDKDGNKLILKGNFDPTYFLNSEIDIQNFSKPNYFEVEIWNGILNEVPIYLLVGSNPIANKILNDHEVYGITTLNAKLGLFALAMKEYMKYCINKDPSKIPEIIHIHDHHPVAALLNCRQELNLVGKDVMSIITMHLLTWPRKELEFFWKSGVNNGKLLIHVGKIKINKNLREIYKLCKNAEEKIPTLEKVGCTVADKVIAVSENFMKSDIIPNCGGYLIKWKCDFTWNGCDWDYNEHKRIVWDKVSKYFPNKSFDDVKSWDFRKLFLKYLLGNLSPNEPIIKNNRIKKIIKKEFSNLPYHPDGTVEPFASDGPMVLVTGRVSPQKGIENILATLPNLIKKIADVKFIFLMVPTPYNLKDLENYMEIAKKYPENVRFLFGIAGSIFLLAHLSADVFCCPSRWEPFGIIALEAMASKIPVVATYVGGLQESIIDIEKNPQKGTGLLCENENVEELGRALVSLVNTMKIAELEKKNHKIIKNKYTKLLNNIEYPNLLKKVEIDPFYGIKLRKNALNRVESTFRWKKVSLKLKQIYLSLNKYENK